MHAPSDPSFRESEVTSDGVDVELEHLRDLQLCQPAEIVELDDPGLALVVHGQRAKCLVECGQLSGAIDDDAHLVEGHGTRAVAALAGVAPASVINEDLAHRPRSDREEVHAIIPFRRLADLRQPQVRLGDQIPGAERVIRSLSTQVPLRETLELRVDARHELVERALVTGSPLTEQERQRARPWLQASTRPQESNAVKVRARFGTSAVASRDNAQTASET